MLQLIPWEFDQNYWTLLSSIAMMINVKCEFLINLLGLDLLQFITRNYWIHCIDDDDDDEHQIKVSDWLHFIPMHFWPELLEVGFIICSAANVIGRPAKTFPFSYLSLARYPHKGADKIPVRNFWRKVLSKSSTSQNPSKSTSPWILNPPLPPPPFHDHTKIDNKIHLSKRHKSWNWPKAQLSAW